MTETDSNLDFSIKWRVHCPNYKCKGLNELDLILILMCPSPDALLQSPCESCNQPFIVRWTTDQPERIKLLKNELNKLKQNGTKLIRQHLIDLQFGLVALTPKPPNIR